MGAVYKGERGVMQLVWESGGLNVPRSSAQLTKWMLADGCCRLLLGTCWRMWGMTFWDWSAFAGPKSISLERQIHDSMFPPSEFEWEIVAAAAGEALESKSSSTYRKWRNRRCDVQGMLAHIMNGGEFVVSSDKHFLGNSEAFKELGAGAVLTPWAAAELI